MSRHVERKISFNYCRFELGEQRSRVLVGKARQNTNECVQCWKIRKTKSIKTEQANTVKVDNVTMWDGCEDSGRGREESLSRQTHLESECFTLL
jgi:hypothetical protein